MSKKKEVYIPKPMTEKKQNCEMDDYLGVLHFAAAGGH